MEFGGMAILAGEAGMIPLADVSLIFALAIICAIALVVAIAWTGAK